jgi:hypothetical protein
MYDQAGSACNEKRSSLLQEKYISPKKSRQGYEKEKKRSTYFVFSQGPML